MDLVIMAAGLGSRFGGSKQVEPVDDDGNFILDYSVFDAIKAGFDRVVLIIRPEHKDIFEQSIGKRLRKIIPVKYAYQTLEDVPAGVKIPEVRVKPWGTAHAIYSCRNIVSDRFAVINADDFYGFDTIKIIADFLKTSKDDEFVSAGFKAENTLSENGSVKRGIFQMRGKTALGLVESKVERRGDKIFATPLTDNNWEEIKPETMVSMQCFGFSKKLIEEIKKEIKQFFIKSSDRLDVAEFLLPDVVGEMIKKGTTLKVVPTKSQWYGVTYREDLENFKNAIEKMKKSGKYPRHLYS